MDSFVVIPKNENEYKFLFELLQKLKIKTRKLSEEEIEDIGMSILMKSADRTKKVSRGKVISKLESL
ncbi:MAG: hypothetical protein ACOYMF_00225 [Bacteroidales bacterium]